MAENTALYPLYIHLINMENVCQGNKCSISVMPNNCLIYEDVGNIMLHIIFIRKHNMK